MDSLLHKLYFNPLTGFIASDKLYRKANAIDKSITKKQVNEWYRKQTSIQKFSNHSKKRFSEFNIASDNPNEWQIDLAFWEKKPILIAVNINSRIGFAKLIKDKRAETINNAVEQLLRKYDVSAFMSDNGSEFTNNIVENFFKSNSITHANSFVGDHTVLGKIDRFIRTLKFRLTKMKESTYFKTLTQKILNDAIINYNNTYHSSIEATPNEMKGKVMFNEIEHNKNIVKQIQKEVPIGSLVRYRLKSKVFQKEGAKWSSVVYEVIGLDGLKMKIKSKNNHVIFAPVNDLKIVDASINNAPEDPNQLWEVEKIIDHQKQRNGKYKYLIKWIGYNDPSWESQDNLRLINKNEMSQLEKDYFDLIN